MNDRRNFIRGAGIIGAFVVGAASYKQVKEMATEHKDISHKEMATEHKDISHLAPPINAITIQFTGAYGEKPKAPEPTMGQHTFYVNGWNEEVTHRVSMTVGKDNRLWMKIGDEWHRVAIES
jgi:hypothetical protein